MFLLAVPPEIILPLDWFVVFATTLDGANPIDPVVFVSGFDMPRQIALGGKALVANVTTGAGSDIVWRACCCNFNRGRAVRLLGFIPRVGRIWNGRLGEVVGVEEAVA